MNKTQRTEPWRPKPASAFKQTWGHGPIRLFCLALALALAGAFWTGPTSAAEQPPAAEASAESERALRVETFEAAWRIINDSYFDPSFRGLDWNAVRTELRPKAEAARNTRQLREIIEEMLERLGDSHMSVIPGDLADSLDRVAKKTDDPAAPDDDPVEDGAGDAKRDAGAKPSRAVKVSNGGPGFDVRVLHGHVLVTRVEPNGPAANAGVKPGWILRAIDQEPVQPEIQRLFEELEPRRAHFMAWGLVTGLLGGQPGSSVSLQFLNQANASVALTLERQEKPGLPTKLGFLPKVYSHLDSQRLAGPGHTTVGLIRFNLWMVPIVRALEEKVDEFRGADGIILDLRGNIGGIGGMIIGVSGHFLDERISLGTLKMRHNELNFFNNPRRVNPAGERVQPYSGPLAILIDNLSLSAAEIFAGGMQAVGRARVFGEQSGGQALPALWDRLPNGDVLYHAIGDFVVASGARVEGRGVTPDEMVPINRAGLVAGRDAPLEAALRWIGQQKAQGHSVR